MSKHKYRPNNLISESIRYFLMLLWIYAAISKLLDYGNFQIQLAQSPLLSPYAAFLSWMVPVTEILAAGFLCFRQTYYWGWVLSFTLMSGFTAYIFIILNYADFVPCSCGGILEAMGWREHLIFNIGCLVLIPVALLLSSADRVGYLATRWYLGLPGLSGLLAVGLVAILYWNSEKIIHRENPFIRRYSHGVLKNGVMELNSGENYLAGVKGDIFYLGSFTNPLQVTLVDSLLRDRRTQSIQIQEDDLPSTAVQLRLRPPHFYLVDGQISRVLRGSISDWTIDARWDGQLQFSEYQLVEGDRLVFRSILQEGQGQTLGILQLQDSLPYSFQNGLLQKQLDGFFDVDGSLSLDRVSGRITYTYYYRNSFLVMDDRLNLMRRGHTIDTLERAQLRIDSVSIPGQRKLLGSLQVNASSYASDGMLYIRSRIKGRFEPPRTWEQTETIDVYDLGTGNYRTSFYVYAEDGEPVRDFFVLGNRFYGFAGTKLVCYDLSGML